MVTPESEEVLINGCEVIGRHCLDSVTVLRVMTEECYTSAFE